MLRDSVRAKRPGLELHDAACMVVLREELGFPDALVEDLQYSNAPGAPVSRYLIIKLVEPGQRARVKWLPPRADSFKVVRPEYATVLMPATDSTGDLWPSRILWPLQYYGRGRDAMANASRKAPANVRADAERLWHFLGDHKRESDRVTALEVLRNDGAYADRLIATAILSNFSEQDPTWFALTDALRDPSEPVRNASAAVLAAFPSRVVDWSSKTETLRWLVGGTNVAASELVFTMLARTKISPVLAKSLLKDNEFWVLTHLRASFPGAAPAARSLLTQLNGGNDFGSDPAKWHRWVQRL